MRVKLLTRKAKFFSLEMKLTLVNSVLSSIPTYSLSIFKLPCWAIKATDCIRRDFLWSRTNTEDPRPRSVNWRRLCRSKERGGCSILNLKDFNLALLCKLWCKVSNIILWCGAKVIQLNYFQNSLSLLEPLQSAS